MNTGTINAAFGQSVTDHVTCIAPRQSMQDMRVKQLSNPLQMDEQGLFRWWLDLLCCRGCKYTVCVDDNNNGDRCAQTAFTNESQGLGGLYPVGDLI